MAGFTYSLKELADHVDAQVQGDEQIIINGLSTLQDAEANQISFLANPQYRKQLADTQAGAVLLTEKDAQVYPGNCLIVADPYLAFARISHLFDPKPKAQPGIHPSAHIDDSAQIDATACIGPGVVIE